MSNLQPTETYLSTVLRAPDVETSPSISVARDVLAAAAGAALFGLALAAFSHNPQQMFASALKLPLLLLGTALLCLPTFHLVQVGRAEAPLPLSQTLRIQSTALAATGLTWAALSLPVLFLVATTQQYVLARVIAVLVGAAGGMVGLSRFRTLCAACQSGNPTASDSWSIRLYLMLFSVVGLQLAWSLRPFIGSPLMDFTWFRAVGTTPLAMIFGG